MLTNLFSIFDPSTSIYGLPLGWLSITLSGMLLFRVYWVSGDRVYRTLKKIMETLTEEMGLLFSPKTLSVTILPLSIFVFIAGNNLLGLLPHVFTGTSHLSITLSLSLPVWLGMMFYAILNNLESLLAHLVPQGTPPALMMFMVLIETISSVIRPFTLAVRLGANMIAGHLLLALLSGAADITSNLSSNGAGLSLTLLLLLEVAVAVIQSYVFMTLVSLYISEV